MEFNVLDRLILLGMLRNAPAEGSITMFRILRSLQDDLGFTEEELKELNFQHKEDPATKQSNTTWDKDIRKDIEIGPKASEFVADIFRKLDKAEKLQAMHVSLYERFVKDVEDESVEWV